MEELLKAFILKGLDWRKDVLDIEIKGWWRNADNKYVVTYLEVYNLRTTEYPNEIIIDVWECLLFVYENGNKNN